MTGISNVVPVIFVRYVEKRIYFFENICLEVKSYGKVTASIVY